jgi:HEAT repeat protein
MKRLYLSVFVGLLLPAIASAQGVPPAPPVPPVPPAAPVMPVRRPTPMPDATPMPMAPDVDFNFDVDSCPMAIDTAAIRDQVRAAADQARDMAAMARMDADMVRQNMKLDIDLHMQGPAAAAYRGGLDALQQRQYDRAIAAFDRVINQKTDRADAALYWKAFAQFKLARTDDAVASIAKLRQDFPQSRYLNEAKVLEADVRRMAGQPVNVAGADDDEIKLLAIQGIQKSEQAVPLLEGVLNATNSLNVKKRALYVLALSDDPRAHELLMRYAKGGGNPDLQVESIRYLASRRDSKTTPAELRSIYDSTQDANVKMAVIDAYRMWGDKTALVRISGEKGATVDLRRSAITRLGGLADVQDVMGLFQQETDPALRQQLVSVLASMSAVDQLTTIAKTDKDTSVRVRAIRVLGSQRNDRTAQTLVGLYGSEQDKDVRRAVIQSLMGQSNADALVSLARKETDPDLKRDLVRRLAEMAPTSKAAADYLVEQLK